jgi:hypothetical protein
MPGYRLYIVGTDGRFSNVEVIESANDQEAIEKSRQLIDGHDLELWDRGRRVARFSRDGSQSGRDPSGEPPRP